MLRLAPQREDYLSKSLRGYKSGARHGYEPTIAEALQPVDDAPMVELAYCLAHYRRAAGGRTLLLLPTKRAHPLSIGSVGSLAHSPIEPS